MNLSDHDIVQLTEWLHALEEGTLEESQRAQFEAMLAQNDAARRFYVQRMTLGAALCKLADEAQGAEGSEGDDGANRATPIPQTRRKWPAMSTRSYQSSVSILCSAES